MKMSQVTLNIMIQFFFFLFIFNLTSQGCLKKQTHAHNNYHLMVIIQELMSNIISV